jgi:hypothetical protein
MSTETLTPEAKEAVIKNAATALISAAAAKAGIPVSQVPQSAVDDAFGFARSNFESEERKQSNEYYHLYQQQKADNEALKAQLGAVRENKAATVDNRIVPTVEQVREGMGRAQWYQLSEGQKLTALGIDPASIDKEATEHVLR